jgi:hypothetical protein
MVERLIAAPGLLLKDWGEAVAVVYSPANISTLLVSAEAAAVLQRCLAGAEVTALDGSPDTVSALLSSGLLRRAQ